MRLAFLLLLAACDFDIAGDCANEMKQNLLSPDGKHRAITFIRDCGATTASSPQVVLLAAGGKLTSSMTGNVYRGNRSDNIEIVWAPGRLTVRTDAQLVMSVPSKDGVEIDVRPFRE